MSLQQILGQEKAIRLIRKAISHERIPHAWLFSGMAHIGKYKTALALSQTLNCLENGDDACVHCDFCRQIEYEHFPDFRVVRPEGKNIRIAQVRDALDWLHLRPDRAKYRVLIFEDADQFNRESANAFLKTLEEPPPDTLIILINLNPQNLLETIVSRCQHIRFHPLSREMVLEILRAETELSEDQFELLVSFGAGGVRSDLALQVELMQNIQDSVIGSLMDLSAQCMESRCFREPTIGPNQKMRNGGWFWMCWKTGSGIWPGLSIIFRSRICFMQKKNRNWNSAPNVSASRMFTSSVKIWRKQEKTLN